MNTPETIILLENYVNPIFLRLATLYTQYSGQEMICTKLFVKDRIGFLYDYVKKNTSDSLIAAKVDEIFAVTEQQRSSSWENQLQIINRSALEVLLGVETIQKLKSMTEERRPEEMMSPAIHSADTWIETFWQGVFTMPSSSGEIMLAERVMFVQPAVSKNTLYIHSWNESMVEHGKLKDNVKSTAIHECVHLLTHQLPGFSTLRMDRSLALEEQLTYKWLDEGAAEYFAMFDPGLYQNPYHVRNQLRGQKIMSRLYGLTSLFVSLIYKFPEEINPYQQRLQAYNFFQYIHQRFGLREIFHILVDPRSVTAEILSCPKHYTPRVA